MRTNSTHNATAQFRILSDDQCEQIVLAAFEVLERVGGRFYEPAALQILEQAGCIISDGLTARIPAGVIKHALRSAPNCFTLYTREGEPSLRVEPNNVHFGPGPTCPNFIDPQDGTRRLYVKNDAALTARVCDALPEIDYVMSLGSINDVPQDEADVHEFDATVRETTKPIMSWSFSLESLERIHEMCTAIKGSAEAFAREPFMIFYAEPSSPLKHTAEALRKLIYCAKHRIPIVYTPCCISGGTAPATMAGILVQNLAETLCGVVLGQQIRRGAPIVVGGVVSILDMRTTILSYGAPELSLLSAAAAELAQYLGLPVFSTGGCTDSKCLDEQAAIEATTSITFAQLSGADFIHDVGFTESAMVGSLQQLVMSNEIISMVRHVTRGIQVDEKHLAVDAIAEAVEVGDYLSLDHTAEHFRDQFWFPKLLDRYRVGEWKSEGGLTMGDRVRQSVRDIIDNHRAVPLDLGLAQKLDQIVGSQLEKDL